MLYEELLGFAKPRLDEFFANAKLFEGQFTFSPFHAECFHRMYEENSYPCKTVKELKAEIPSLSELCAKCAPFYLAPRNESRMKLDLQMGILFEDILIDFFRERLHLKAMHADKSDKRYPDCMILCPDKQIAAYFEVKYHSAPFISAISKLGRYCYEGSVTLDYKKIVKQLELVESDIDRPVYYLHWVDFPCLKGIFFQTSEQIKEYLYASGEEFVRERRRGDGDKSPGSVYLSKFYPPMLDMGTFEEFVGQLRALVKERDRR